MKCATLTLAALIEITDANATALDIHHSENIPPLPFMFFLASPMKRLLARHLLLGRWR
jgi:hypothetical protein